MTNSGQKLTNMIGFYMSCKIYSIMGRNPEQVNSLSEAVRQEINILPHVKTALSEGIVNYSALARKLMDNLGEKLGRKLNEESLIVAIKRYADELGIVSNQHSHIELFSEGEITLQDNMCYAHFKKKPNVLSKIEKLFGEENWKLGEMRVLIQGAEQVMVIMKENRLEEIMAELSDDIIFSLRNSALLTFRMPFESFTTYGVLAELTSHLAKKGISIELLSSPPDIHFLVDEKDAQRTYSVLRQLINDSKNAMAQKASKPAQTVYK